MDFNLANGKVNEILANQHFNSIKQFSDELNLNVVLLTGKTSVADKKIILNELSNNL